MQKLRWLNSLCLFLLLALAACGSDATSTTKPIDAPTATVVADPTKSVIPTVATSTAETTPIFPVSVTDASGNTVTAGKKAERVVCVGPACIEIMADLNMLPVGSTFMTLVKRNEFFGARAKEIAEVSGTTADPNLEQIVQLKPDLVIGEEGFTTKLREALKTVAPIYEVKVAGYAEAIKNLRDVGKLVGLTGQAEILVDRFNKKITAYAAKSPKDKTVLLMSDYAIKPTFTTEKAAFCLMLAETARGCPLPPTGNMVRGRFEYSLERILEANPDVLFVGVNPTQDASKNNQSKQSMETNPFWKELKAVKNGQVFEVDTQIWVRTELRSLNLMLDEAMTKIYPGIFSKPLNP